MWNVSASIMLWCLVFLLLKEIVFAGKFCQTPWCQAKPPPCLNNGERISWKYNIVASHYFLFGKRKQLWTTIIQNFRWKIYQQYIIGCHFFNGDRYLQRHYASQHHSIIIIIAGQSATFPKPVFKHQFCLDKPSTQFVFSFWTQKIVERIFKNICLNFDNTNMKINTHCINARF